MIDSVSLTHLGLVRECNEDSIVEDASLGLWVVADGVGGNGCGDVASQIATQTIQRRVRQGASLVRAIQDAHSAIMTAAADTPSCRDMATTVVACHIDRNAYEIAWVGDSRGYLINTTGISQLTHDHNLAEALVAQGVLSHNEARDHPGQHELTQALGYMRHSKPSVCLGELHPGEYLLLCSDGVSGVLSDEEIRQVVLSSNSPAEQSQMLLSKVLDAGAPDNLSFVLLRYAEDHAPTKASDFESSALRFPLRVAPYLSHLSSRQGLLILIVLSMALVAWWL